MVPLQSRLPVESLIPVKPNLKTKTGLSLFFCNGVVLLLSV